MRIFRFFITKIFLRKVILSIAMILLFLMANYTIFTATSSFFSTFQGYQELETINQKGTYVANLDPDSNIDMDIIKKNGTQRVYNYLNKNFKYAFYSDGFIVSLPNKDGMEISCACMNEEYYKLNQFELSQGTDLNFDYQFNKDIEIPILVGRGLSKTYPIGSTIKVKVPMLERSVTLKVKGVLKQNAYHSNFYAVSSKNYYNFSIFLPVNEEFLKHANIDLQLNGLMDIIILQTTKEKVSNLSKIMQADLGLKFNFYSQKENFDYFNEYYISSLRNIFITTLVLVVVIICISVWNALVSVRLMVRDFTINLLVGLSYSKLKKILYSYYGMLFSINLLVLFLMTAYSRYGSWLRKDTSFVTYGLFGLIEMDWFALSVVLLSDIIIGVIIVEAMMRKIEKIPISLGVLQ